MTETIDSDCWGRYYSDMAPECKICRDASGCKKQTTQAGYYVAPVVEASQLAEIYTTAKIVEVIGKIGLPGCKASNNKVSIFEEKVRCVDVVCAPKAMVIYSMYALPGLVKYSETDPRGYRGKVYSYEDLEVVMRALDSVRK